VKKNEVIRFGNHFENFKRKTHKVHKKKSSFKYLKYVPIEHKKIDKGKKIHFKRTFENKVQF
jgi:hypothetical protein